MRLGRKGEALGEGIPTSNSCDRDRVVRHWMEKTHRDTQRLRREGETLDADRPRQKAKVERGGRDTLRTLLNPISATQ